MWAYIPGTDGNYSASTEGKIRRNAGKDSIGRRIKMTVLTPGSDKKGRLYVNISSRGKMTSRSVSRLVAEAFIPDFGPSCQVRHKNSDKSDCSVENLILCENDKGENNGFSSLTKDDVRGIRLMGNEGRSSAYIAKYYNTTSGTVRSVITGRTWDHLPLMNDNGKNGNYWGVVG